jgi:hypothetical protein
MSQQDRECATTFKPPVTPPEGSPDVPLYIERKLGMDSKRSSTESSGFDEVYVNEWVGEKASHISIKSADQLRAEIESRPENDRCLFIVHGLPSEHTKVLQESLDIDREFIEAHVGRRSYRPLTHRLRGRRTKFIHYDYPELVRCDSLPLEQLTSGIEGVLGDSPTHMTSKRGDAAVFCRTSMWLHPKANGE